MPEVAASFNSPLGHGKNTQYPAISTSPLTPTSATTFHNSNKSINSSLLPNFLGTSTSAFEGDLGGRSVAIKHFTIGVDWGTTFTSVSYCVSSGPRTRASDVKSIKNWPDDPSDGFSEQVPSELWYASVAPKRPAVKDQFDDPDRNVKDEYLAWTKQISQSVFQGEPEDVEDEEEDCQVDNDQSTELLWGYSVHYQMYTANTTRNPNRRIDRAKLMLIDPDNTSYCDGDRVILRKRLNYLLKKGIIRKYGKGSTPDVRDVRDIITDFFIKVFEHSKNQLIQYEEYNSQCSVEFAITVPTIWNSESSRILQASIEAAMLATGFGTLLNGSVSNLFLIPEPEAAATYLLGQSNTVMVC
jgi:hypothetical protein